MIKILLHKNYSKVSINNFLPNPHGSKVRLNVNLHQKLAFADFIGCDNPRLDMKKPRKLTYMRNNSTDYQNQTKWTNLPSHVSPFEYL